MADTVTPDFVVMTKELGALEACVSARASAVEGEFVLTSWVRNGSAHDNPRAVYQIRDDVMEVVADRAKLSNIAMAGHMRMLLAQVCQAVEDFQNKTI